MARVKQPLEIEGRAFIVSYEDDPRYVEENNMWAREAMEEVVNTAVRSRPEATNADIMDIAYWAAPYVAKHYNQVPSDLFHRWAKHAGPPVVQIAMNPALAKAFAESEIERLEKKANDMRDENG